MCTVIPTIAGIFNPPRPTPSEGFRVFVHPTRRTKRNQTREIKRGFRIGSKRWAHGNKTVYFERATGLKCMARLIGFEARPDHWGIEPEVPDTAWWVVHKSRVRSKNGGNTFYIPDMNEDDDERYYHTMNNYGMYCSWGPKDPTP